MMQPFLFQLCEATISTINFVQEVGICKSKNDVQLIIYYNKHLN